MKCPICSEDVSGAEQARQWGPEWAHGRCVTAYNRGKAAEREARIKAQDQVADLQERIARADVERQRAVAAAQAVAQVPRGLAFQLLAAANYIDALGGDSRSYRQALNAFTEAPAPMDHTALLQMLARRARSFPHYPLGYHIPEVFAAVGESPPEAPAQAPRLTTTDAKMEELLVQKFVNEAPAQDIDKETQTMKLMGLVDDLIEQDPERAERFIESALAKNALRKRLKEKKATHPSVPAVAQVPTGYKLVPSDAHIFNGLCPESYGDCQRDPECPECRSMLAAAPEAPTPDWRSALDRFASKERGIAQAHIAAELVAEFERLMATPEAPAQAPMPWRVFKQVTTALAGLLEQVEKFTGANGEADFETGEALRAVEAAIQFDAQMPSEAPAQAVSEREAFQAWVRRDRGGNVTPHPQNPNRYASATVQGWWQAWQSRAALAQQPAAQGEHRVPDGVWEALQRMIEDGMLRGPGSREDAKAVAQWRSRFVPARDGKPAAQPIPAEWFRDQVLLAAPEAPGQDKQARDDL